MTAAGCTRTYDHIWPGSDLPYQANFHLHVERLRPICNTLAAHGMTFGIEFIGPRTMLARYRHPFIHTLDGALELIDAVGEGCSLAFDAHHFHCSGATVDDLDKLRGISINCVHLNDSPPRPLDQQEDLIRAMPMETGVIDLPGVIRRLQDLDCDAPVFAEPFNPARERLSTLRPDQAAREAFDSLQQAFAAAGVKPD